MVQFGVAVQRLWRKFRDFFRVLWCFVSRLCCKVVGFVCSLFSRRDAREVNNENHFPGNGATEEGQSAAAAASGVNGNHDDDEDDDFDGQEYRVDAADELHCDYDSTWETEERQQSSFTSTRRPAALGNHKFRRFEIAARDMQNYRHDYPYAMSSYDDNKPNLEFYTGKRPCLPDAMYIHEFHDNWRDNYDDLESVHTYIQWLFPLQEQGVNSEASTLTKEEIKNFPKNCIAMANLLKSYKLMLNGIKLCDERTGEVERAENWRERFDNLNSHTHNSLRITRILKCLGTLGYRRYQQPLVHFFLKETLNNKELPHIKDSVLNYFVFAVRDKVQRRRLIKFAYLCYEPKDEFVWCPKKIQMTWSCQFALRAQEGFNVKQHATTQH